MKVDKADRKLIGDLFFILAILAFTIVAYVRLDNNPSVLFACGLALTFFVAAEIVLTH